MMKKPRILVAALLAVSNSCLHAFVLPSHPGGAPWLVQHRAPAFLHLSFLDEELFEDEEEMFPVAEHYVRNKYKAVAEAHGHNQCTADDAREVLASILPPVSKQELDDEVTKTLGIVMKSNPANSQDKIDEDDFVSAIVQNSYWKAAGSLVVKELMYFDSLHSYYQTGSALLNDGDYEQLKDNLTWEGSSVPTMKAKEAMFVTAVASARRGEPIMEDAEYAEIKAELKKQGSWVVNREADALERLGLNTFMGYLHRSLRST